MKYFMMTGTITYALRGRDVLRRNGFSAYVERTQQKKDHAGCGYGIAVAGNLEDIKRLLVANGIRLLGHEVVN